MVTPTSGDTDHFHDECGVFGVYGHPDAAALYSRRSRRLVQSYLRLKLWEMREADLERARKVIERKLGIGALLGETPAPTHR